MDGIKINHPNDTAVLADGMKLGGPWVMREAEIAGEVRFASARIGGGLLWEDCKIGNNKIAVAADGTVCDGPWVLRRAAINRSIPSARHDGQGHRRPADDRSPPARKASTRGARTSAATSSLMAPSSRAGCCLARAQVVGELTAKGADSQRYRSGLGDQRHGLDRWSGHRAGGSKAQRRHDTHRRAYRTRHQCQPDHDLEHRPRDRCRHHARRRQLDHARRRHHRQRPLRRRPHRRAGRLH